MNLYQLAKRYYYKKRIIRYLEFLGNGGNPKHVGVGICFVMSATFPKVYIGIWEGEDLAYCWTRFICEMAESWEYHSGNLGYPISTSEDTPAAQYDRTRNKWDKNTEYGRKRRELCLLIASKLRALKNEN